MPYSVEWHRAARRELDGLDRQVARRIIAAVGELGNEPRPVGCRRLVGSTLWRIRVGDYRVIYDIEDGRLVVLVLHVAHRREVYR